MRKIDCRTYADEIIEQVKQNPNKKELVIITAGDDPASAAYMKGKMADCEKCGVPCRQIRVATQEELLWRVGVENGDEEVGGIIVQLPLPEGFDEQEAVNAVASRKDVDGFKANSPFLPCTPEGIMYILDKEVGDLAGKTVLLIGKGKLIGKPLIDILLAQGCTLTVAHSKTKNLERLLGQYHDVVITGVGKPRLVDMRLVTAEVVIDAGISRDENGKLCGDCFGFDDSYCWGMGVTTVPGGVGLLTRAMLMKHMGEG